MKYAFMPRICLKKSIWHGYVCRRRLRGLLLWRFIQKFCQICDSFFIISCYCLGLIWTQFHSLFDRLMTAEKNIWARSYNGMLALNGILLFHMPLMLTIKFLLKCISGSIMSEWKNISHRTIWFNMNLKFKKLYADFEYC